FLGFLAPTTTPYGRPSRGAAPAAASQGVGSKPCGTTDTFASAPGWRPRTSSRVAADGTTIATASRTSRESHRRWFHAATRPSTGPKRTKGSSWTVTTTGTDSRGKTDHGERKTSTGPARTRRASERR